MNTLTKTDKIAYFVLGVIFLIGLYFGFTDLNYFDTGFTVEDGPVEWGTAIMLFCVFVLSVYHLFSLWKYKKALWRLGTLAFIVLFFFAAGEEISWGQRIFGIESGEFFQQNNAQGETNLHNLVVGDTKINKLIFSQLLMLVMVIYLLVTPFLYRKKEWVRSLFDRFAVPVVKWHHTIAFIIGTVLVAINPSSRKWEVYELAFGLIFFLIFLNPFNKRIFEKE
ncbi:hypothetical protein GWK08_02070 [Leptobacterium flavescens]|uniref:Uncharacterized protein n=1 Tax=Leptobacterium flavescens TaxID=472055 RepID=A0A6P0UGS3_9FLAO|nr:hypothetical protein [Leptobacterium flavescens]NER12217.1 hypothetical protein [Leptobacterium flavescens]